MEINNKKQINSEEETDTILELEDTLQENGEVQEEFESDIIEKFTDNDWYILQTYSTHEYKVRARIEKFMEEGLYPDSLGRVLIPEQETVEIKNNKRTEKVSKIFPGYVFVQIKIDQKLVYELKSVPGVSRFLGVSNDGSLVPVQEEDILKVLRKVGDKTKEIDIDFEKGEVIKVISGPFRGYSGAIAEINPVKGKLKTMISIFGRDTSVELEFSQVEKTI